jgi:hypothetical protein
MSSVWLSGWGWAAAWGGAVPVGGDSGLLRDCVQEPLCAETVGAAGADALREAAAAAEGLAVGLSPAVVRGTGLSMELSAQTLVLPALFAPNGVDVVPAIPRLALGGFAGRRLRYGGGVQGGVAAPTGSDDMGFSFGGRGGLALGSPEERRWVGFELDLGYATVQGDLFDDHSRAASALTGREMVAPECLGPCTDVLNMLHVGVDSTFTLDVDAMTVLFGRVGGVFQRQTLAVEADESRWAWNGLLPRLTLGAAYRPQPHALLSAAVRLGLLEENRNPGSGLLWLAAVSLGWRFGPDAAVPQPIAAPPPAPVVLAPAPVVVPKIPVAEHPELECGPSRIPTGAPPPLGLEGWCVMIDERGNVLTDGPYLRWHDPEHIAERGENRMGRPAGTWTKLDPQGALLSHGVYADGLKEGLWRTFYPSGQRETEVAYHRGRESGSWMAWTEDGQGHTAGNYVNGVRDGIWVDYRDGAAVRRRVFRDGNVVDDEFYELPQE